jgi:beta-lactamase regulating signal transducer with metallopeptidase domain
MNSELEFAHAGATWLLAWSWQALLLLGAVWLMLKVSRVQAPILRHQIWLVGLLTVALLPLCSLVASRWPKPQVDETAYIYWLEWPQTVTAPTPVAAVKAVPETITVATHDWHYLLGPLAFLAWLLGFGWALLRFGAGVIATSRLRRSARIVSLAELDCGLTERGRVGLSPDTQSPMLTGLLRPLILLPADIMSWTNADERRAMVQHELAHLERRDHYVNALQSLLSAVFFFHPLVRFACRQMTLERELACDDRVVSLGADSATYAESILKVAERNIVPRGLHQPAFFSTQQLLERRLTMILNPDRLRTIQHSWRYLLLPVGLLAVLAVLLTSGSIKGQSQANAQEDDLVERAIANPDLNVRLAAVQRLAQIKGERGTLSLTEVYQRSEDTRLKEEVIRKLGERGEMMPLSAIRQIEKEKDLRQLVSDEIEGIITRRARDFREQNPNLPPPPPPPPPPPMRASLPEKLYDFEVIGSEERNLLEPIKFSRDSARLSRPMRVKLPRFSIVAAEMVLRDGAYNLKTV